MPIDPLSPSRGMASSGNFTWAKKWHTQGFCRGHFGCIQSSPKGAVANSNNLGPFRHRSGLSIMCYMNIVRSVCHLGPFVSPSDIARLIVSVVVDAVKAHTSRTCSQIGNKSAENKEGSVNGNSTATISRPFSPERILASSFHVAPSRVFLGLNSANLSAMSFHANRITELPC